MQIQMGVTRVWVTVDGAEHKGLEVGRADRATPGALDGGMKTLVECHHNVITQACASGKPVYGASRSILAIVCGSRLD